MILLIQDFGFLSVVLRILVLTLQTLTVGGILYLVAIAPSTQESAARSGILRRCALWISRSAALMAIIGLLYVASDTTVLMGSAGLRLVDLMGAGYFVAGTVTIALSVLIALFAFRMQTASSTQRGLIAILGFGLMLDAVFTSHGVSRLDHRVLLSVLTLLHQGSAAAWLGGLAFFLLSLKSKDLTPDDATTLLRRFSTIAITSVVWLAGTGVYLSLYYIGSTAALYGTAYGVMVVAKAVMLILLVAMGAANFRVGRNSGLSRVAVSFIRRTSELELMTAFTVLLLAASLTSAPPGADMVRERLTLTEIQQRLHPQPPVLKHPPLESLAPATPMEEAARNPDDLERARAHTERDPDLAWSEFEHNWAGVFLCTIGVFAFVSAFPRGRWARYWPLAFIAMSLFLMAFSDPENWPLGPIGYWQSFADPEVLFHRVALSLLIVFAIFETGVQTGRFGFRAAMVFPVVVVLATSGFMTHVHSLGNIRLELLIEISHTPVGIFGFLMGAFRLMEVSLRRDRVKLQSAENVSSLDGPIRFASAAWPICMFMAGLILVNYREG